MKNCKDCNTPLVVGDNWIEASQREYNYRCDVCRKKKYREYRKARRDGKHHVYIVDNYAGVTCDVPDRKRVHKHKGRDISTFQIIYSTPDRVTALELEELLHDIGYEGKHTNSRYA